MALSKIPRNRLLPPNVSYKPSHSNRVKPPYNQDLSRRMEHIEQQDNKNSTSPRHRDTVNFNLPPGTSQRMGELSPVTHTRANILPSHTTTTGELLTHRTALFCHKLAGVMGCHLRLVSNPMTPWKLAGRPLYLL